MPPEAGPAGRTAARSSYHAGLTRTSVVEAAIGLLAAEGAGAFSLRRLAAQLDVDTMALYKHVRNKDDLLGAALARVFRDVRPPAAGAWWEQVGHVFREHRRVVREQPWALTVLLDRTLRSAEPWAGVDEVLALLEDHVGPDGAARWVRGLAAWTNGFLLTEPDLHAPVDDAQVRAERPRVGAAAARNARSGDADFDAGLQLLLDALRAEAADR